MTQYCWIGVGFFKGPLCKISEEKVISSVQILDRGVNDWECFRSDEVKI